MMHTHSLGRAARYYPERAALGSDGRHSTFRQLHDRVAGIAAALAGTVLSAGTGWRSSSRMNPSTSSWSMPAAGWG